MKKLIAVVIITTIAVSGCIGIDIVDVEIVPEVVTITATIDSLRVGDSFLFVADHFDDIGEKTDQPIDWSSTDAAIIDINATGLATAITEGDVYIRARVGTTLDSVKVNAGSTTSIMSDSRTGRLQGRSSYIVEGQFTLTDVGDELELTFGSDFRASNGPGLFVYLSNSSNGVTGGVELGQLMSNSGAQTYIVSKDDAQLNTYSHVIIYCRPFGVTFGFGAFDN